MKRWFAFAAIFAFGVLALVLTQMSKQHVPIGPRSFLNFIADTARELARVPAAVTPLSDSEEVRIGDQLAGDYAASLGVDNQDKDSQKVEAYVQKIGQRVAARSRRKLPYKFHYIPDRNFVNAFALPGGHVFIGAGMVRLMDSEDELANVLGHEVEHIDLRHCADRIKIESTARKIPLGGLVLLPIEVFEAGYSKTEELEADREGTGLAVKSGYSPYGAIRMFQTFDRLEKDHERRAQSPGEEVSDIAWQTLEGYFRTHPLQAERIAQIQQVIADQQWEQLTNEKPLEVKDEFPPQQTGKTTE